MRAFRKLSSVDPTIVELREWSRIDEELKAEHVRLTNRLKHQLWRYYPQIYELANDVGAGWFLDLLEALPTPEKAAKTREKTVARILKQYRIRRFDAAHVLGELRKPALTVAPGTVEAATAGIRILIARLRLINSQLVDAEQQLDRLCKKIVGPVAGEEGESLRALCGTAPVTKRSGKSCLVSRRRACNRRLRNAVHYWAHNAVQHDATSRAKYEALRAKGHGHARALRSVADRLLNVVCAMLRSGTSFDSSLASKKQAGA